ACPWWSAQRRASWPTHRKPATSPAPPATRDGSFGLEQGESIGHLVLELRIGRLLHHLFVELQRAGLVTLLLGDARLLIGRAIAIEALEVGGVAFQLGEGGGGLVEVAL